MTIPSVLRTYLVLKHPHATILCVACGARFEAGRATTGDRGRCPLCSEVVEVGELLRERRRYRSRTVREPARLVPSHAVRATLLFAAFVGLVALAWIWSDPILAFADRIVRALVGDGGG